MLKVIIVEDEKLVRKGMLLSVDWKSMDCMVVSEAEDGLEGINAVTKYHPDLIIADIKMPRMDGITMAEQLRSDGIMTDIIFLTAYSDFTYAQKAIRLLAADYLLKPFEDEELYEAIKQVQRRLQQKEEKQNILNCDRTITNGYIKQAIAYVAMHYQNFECTIKGAANEIGLSEGHLSHVFRRETQYTFMEYLTRYRIQEAMKLLRGGKYKVYEVAELCGYHDITYFSSMFKKMTGMTPREYKER